jgi:hypothetical protein
MTKVRGSMLRDKGKQLMHICRPRKIRQKTRRIRERKKQRAGGNRNSVDGARRRLLLPNSIVFADAARTERGGGGFVPSFFSRSPDVPAHADRIRSLRRPR